LFVDKKKILFSFLEGKNMLPKQNTEKMARNEMPKHKTLKGVLHLL
jgi:hypothetical protein